MPARNGAESNHSSPHRQIKKLPVYLQESGCEVAAFAKVAPCGQAEQYGFDQHAARKWLAVGNIDAAKNYLNKYKQEKPGCRFVGTREPHVPWLHDRDYDARKVEQPLASIDVASTREFRTRYHT